MDLLLIKLSSLGDLVHTFPALTDAKRTLPSLNVDWVCDEWFAPLPSLHPAVRRVLPLPLRAWKKKPIEKTVSLIQALKGLRAFSYDRSIDAQGLIKSALVSACVKGNQETPGFYQRCGYDFHSAREPWSSFFYRHRFRVEKQQTAIQRTRRLFSQSLGYPLPSTPPDPGLLPLPSVSIIPRSILFLPGTSWPSKKWPLSHWIRLSHLLKKEEVRISVPYWGPEEANETLTLQREAPFISRMDPGSLDSLIPSFASHQLVISVESGLGYLMAALGRPTLMLWGPTDPTLIGSFPKTQTHLFGQAPCVPCRKQMCQHPAQPLMPPCLASVTPEEVVRWVLSRLI